MKTLSKNQAAMLEVIKAKPGDSNAVAAVCPGHTNKVFASLVKRGLIVVDSDGAFKASDHA